MDENRALPVSTERLREWTRILTDYRAGKASVSPAFTQLTVQGEPGRCSGAPESWGWRLGL